MIRISDAFTLSVTKLKTRRIRLIVTTVVSGLFFVILAFASSVSNGSIASVEQFSEDGFGSRFITRVDGVSGPSEYDMYQDAALIAKAKIIDKELIAAKKAAAKELGCSEKQVTKRWTNNRVENSHLPFRRRERAMLRFRRMDSLQKFASIHASFYNLFNSQRSLSKRSTFKLNRDAALTEWHSLVTL